MITNATVAYVKTKEQADELTKAWAKVRAQTAGAEEHVMVALVDPQVELLERQNELLERIAVALEKQGLLGSLQTITEEDRKSITEGEWEEFKHPGLDEPIVTPKPKKVKKG